jgi:uncharacterized protein
MGDMSREPSMEEILSSIRRVIARDEAARDTSLEERFGDQVAPEADDGTDDDVLDLTEMETSPVTALHAVDVTALHAVETPSSDVSPVFAPASAPASATPLVSADSEDAARQAIGQLTAVLDQSGNDAEAAAAAPGLTIEAMAEAALRPMLKTWLDTNLPPLVERLVAREIARITGGRI